MKKLTGLVTIKPFGYLCDWGDKNGLTNQTIYYGEPGSSTVDDWNDYPKVHENTPLFTEDQIDSMLKSAVEEERERCAAVCDDFMKACNDIVDKDNALTTEESLLFEGMYGVAETCGAAIRNQGENE